ncbi:AbrB family transcriptional regulator [Aureimonas frigidaquae]|uniref:AbrB family transcriptional regulator n=1 Tax=Aureimonas frigidaquae TaxID=424757 RepID=UPI000AFAB2DB|nr:AbrB family transcriptional regulator [Aureimonas frigidaquae]
MQNAFLPNMLRLLPFLAVGLAGALTFAALGVPAAYLSGAMVPVAMLAVGTKWGPRPPDALLTTLFTFMGLSMGAGVTPDVVERAHTWPASLALLLVSLFAITGSVFVFLVRAARWDRHSAYFASIPGALSYVLATMQGLRGDATKVVQSQSVRVFLLIAILPTMIVTLGTAHGHVPPASHPETTDFLIMLAGGILGAALAIRSGFPGGALVGSFLASAILHATGIVEGRPPQELIDIGFVVLGTVIGLRFRDTTPRQIAANFAASIGAFAVSISVAAALAVLAAQALSISFGQAMIAFAPGGLEAMVMLAFMLDLDPAYVALHQLGRFFVMILLVPVFARLLLGPGWRAP